MYSFSISEHNRQQPLVHCFSKYSNSNSSSKCLLHVVVSRWLGPLVIRVVLAMLFFSSKPGKVPSEVLLSFRVSHFWATRKAATAAFAAVVINGALLANMVGVEEVSMIEQVAWVEARQRCYKTGKTTKLKWLVPAGTSTNEGNPCSFCRQINGHIEVDAAHKNRVCLNWP